MARSPRAALLWQNEHGLSDLPLKPDLPPPHPKGKKKKKPMPASARAEIREFHARTKELAALPSDDGPDDLADLGDSLEHPDATDLPPLGSFTSARR